MGCKTCRAVLASISNKRCKTAGRIDRVQRVRAGIHHIKDTVMGCKTPRAGQCQYLQLVLLDRWTGLPNRASQC